MARRSSQTVRNTEIFNPRGYINHAGRGRDQLQNLPGFVGSQAIVKFLNVGEMQGDGYLVR